MCRSSHPILTTAILLPVGILPNITAMPLPRDDPRSANKFRINADRHYSIRRRNQDQPEISPSPCIGREQLAKDVKKLVMNVASALKSGNKCLESISLPEHSDHLTA